MATLTEKTRQISAIGFGVAFVWIGIQHFTNVGFFVPIVPELLGAPEFWVYASGAAEIVLGMSMILPRTRQQGGMATAAFLILVYWANQNMWINDIPIDGTTFSTSAHIARAMAQLGMIGLALWIAELKMEKE